MAGVPNFEKRIKLAVVILALLLPGSIHAQMRESKAKTQELHLQWLKNLNSSEGDTFLFSEDSGLMLQDSLLVGQASLISAWHQLNKEDRITRYDSLGTFQLYEDQIFVHGIYFTEKGQKYQSVIGWVKQQNWIKAFEAVAPLVRVEEDSRAEIGLLRATWEVYSNQHRPDLIAERVFSPKGRYFYRGEVYRGPEIAQAYGYMKDPSYSIDLTPQKIIQVNSHLIYEVGIFDVGGKGLYFLLWRRENEEWKLLLDFNF